ncbi:MAG TPA: MCP four helix bundle domain-containing protein, partial [Alphaproteobacteria bacterium]|nr:MCP four helix bundle domain-containing protein [Alphaproteobacteria bacterium]
MNAWRNLKIGVRLAAGIGTVLTLLVIVAAAAYVGLNSGNANFGDYRAMARQTAAAGAMNGELLMARLNVKEFLLKGTDNSVDAVTAAIAALQKEIEASQQLFSDSDEDSKTLATISADAQGYNDAFGKVIELRAQRNAFAKQMDELGPRIEADLSGVMDSAFNDGDTAAAYRAGDALRSLLLMRLARAKFLADNAPENIEAVRKYAKEFAGKADAMLAELQNPERRRLSDAAISLAKEYVTAFEGVQTAILARNDIIDNQLNKIGPSMAEQLDAIVKSKKAAQDELGPRAAAAMESSLMVALVIS